MKLLPPKLLKKTEDLKRNLPGLKIQIVSVFLSSVCLDIGFSMLQSPNRNVEKGRGN